MDKIPGEGYCYGDVNKKPTGDDAPMDFWWWFDEHENIVFFIAPAGGNKIGGAEASVTVSGDVRTRLKASLQELVNQL